MMTVRLNWAPLQANFPLICEFAFDGVYSIQEGAVDCKPKNREKVILNKSD